MWRELYFALPMQNLIAYFNSIPVYAGLAVLGYIMRAKVWGKLLLVFALAALTHMVTARAPCGMGEPVRKRHSTDLYHSAVAALPKAMGEDNTGYLGTALFRATDSDAALIYHD